MKKFRWPSFHWKNWPKLLSLDAPDPVHQTATRIRVMERDIGLPAKLLVIGMLFYYLFVSNWFEDVTSLHESSAEVTPRELALQILRRFFLFYVVVNAAVASFLIGMNELPLAWVRRIVFTMAWLDALFLAGLAAVTGGYDSILYWVFLGLILRNAVSTPAAKAQIFLNVVVTFAYLLSGVLESAFSTWESEMVDYQVRLAIEQGPQEIGTEPVLLRFFLLCLMTLCCYGVQVLFDKQRRAEEEAREAALRQEQLQATGRLAAEIAHQLKNPLGIINNAAYTLQRTVKEGKTITQQIQIIREEVERSDRIITELMGYARLSEGKVEKLSVTDELDRAIDQVLPAAANYKVAIARDYAPALPPLLAQRSHVSEVFVNLLQNAREALDGQPNGRITVSAHYGDNYSVLVKVADNGPGIPEAKLPMIFEPYFTTKSKGTGLGLAIVKHNTEIYGGTVEVESVLGKGTCFTLRLPAKTLMRIRK